MPRKRTPGWRAGVLAGCLAGASIHTVAWSAPPANQNLALQKFEQGRGEFQANRYAEALASFQASLELEPSPNSRLYIARCYRALGKVGSAYTTYRLAASEAEDRVRATGEARYGATRDTATKEADEIQTKVPSLALIVPADVPADFSLTVDAAALNRAAWSSRLTVDPGAHVVKATGARLRPFEVSVTVAEGEKKDVAIQAAHLPTASLQISWQTKPSVFAVSIDGKSVDTDSLEKPRDVDVGEHTIVVSSPGYKSFNWTKRLADGDTANVTVALTPDVQSGPVQVSAGGGSPKWLFFAVAGASVVTIAGGTVVYMSANSIVSDEKAKDPLLRDPGRKDDADSKLATSRILYGVGGALAAGAVVLAFTTSWKSTKGEGAFIRPWVGPGGGGLSARGAF